MSVFNNPKSVFICCPVTDWRPVRPRVYPASHSKAPAPPDPEKGEAEANRWMDQTCCSCPLIL